MRPSAVRKMTRRHAKGRHRGAPCVRRSTSLLGVVATRAAPHRETETDEPDARQHDEAHFEARERQRAGGGSDLHLLLLGLLRRRVAVILDLVAEDVHRIGVVRRRLGQRDPAERHHESDGQDRQETRPHLPAFLMVAGVYGDLPTNGKALPQYICPHCVALSPGHSGTQRRPTLELLAVEQPRVTVVVAQRERLSPVKKTLDRLLESLNIPHRLIYVDGGSPRKLARWLREK